MSSVVKVGRYTARFDDLSIDEDEGVVDCDVRFSPPVDLTSWFFDLYIRGGVSIEMLASTPTVSLSAWKLMQEGVTLQHASSIMRELLTETLEFLKKIDDLNNKL